VGYLQTKFNLTYYAITIFLFLCLFGNHSPKAQHKYPFTKCKSFTTHSRYNRPISEINTQGYLNLQSFSKVKNARVKQALKIKPTTLKNTFCLIYLINFVSVVIQYSFLVVQTDPKFPQTFIVTIFAPLRFGVSHLLIQSGITAQPP